VIFPAFHVLTESSFSAELLVILLGPGLAVAPVGRINFLMDSISISLGRVSALTLVKTVAQPCSDGSARAAS
jgi:hypothetical protein